MACNKNTNKSLKQLMTAPRFLKRKTKEQRKNTLQIKKKLIKRNSSTVSKINFTLTFMKTDILNFPSLYFIHCVFH